jgi:uncharacterized protein HemX
MDGQGARRLALVAPSTIIASLCVALAVSLGLNLWQYGVIQGQRSVNTSLKATATVAQTKQQEVELKRKITRDEADKRFDQLYKELENLSRLSDQVLDAGQRPTVMPGMRDQLVEPARVP